MRWFLDEIGIYKYITNRISTTGKVFFFKINDDSMIRKYEYGYIVKIT
jgi:hypothetical protein